MHIRLLTRQLLLVHLVFFLSLSAAAAQTESARVVGLIIDSQGGRIPGAEVDLVSEETSWSRSTVTDASGWFEFVNLRPGRYLVAVAADRFREADRDGVVVRVDQTVRIDFRLTPAGSAETVEVIAPVTSEEPGELQMVVGESEIRDLPLNGRQLQELTLTTAGVFAGGGFRSTAFNQFGLATAQDGNAGAFTVNGAGSRANGFLLDGVDINVPEQGVIAFPPATEAIQEFEVKSSSYSAEYGRYSGAIVNMVTKSGTNRFHGSLYEFFRNDVLDANNFFNNRAGLPRSKLRQNQFGFTFGGPIQRNRHFFFVNYEGSRIRVGTGPFSSTVPTESQRNGQLTFRSADGSTQTLDLGDQVTPVSRAFLERVPLPTQSGPGANFLIDGTQSMTENQFTLRTDHQLSARDTLMIRYTFDDQDQFFPFDVFFVGPPLPTFPFDNPEQRHSVAISEVHTFSPSLMNEFRFGLNRQTNPINNLDTTDPAEIGLPNGAPQDVANGLPTVSVAGFGGSAGQPLAGGGFTGFFSNRTVYQYIDHVSWIRGSHHLRFGGEARWIQINNGSFGGLRGSVVFNGSRNGLIDPSIPSNTPAAAFADFLLGLPSQASISEGSRQRGFRRNSVDLYIQDRIQVSSQLTLDVGLRYELNSPPGEVNGLQSNFVPGRGVLIDGSAELPDIHEWDKNNFAPRFGLAYRITPESPTVIRAGAGVFYDHAILQDRTGSGVAFNPPFGLSVTSNSPSPFPADGSDATTFTDLLGGGVSTGVSSVDTGFRSPYSVQWNLGVQHQFFQNTLLEVAYVGRRGVNLSRRLNINQVPAASFAPEELAEVARENSEVGTSVLRPFFGDFSSDIMQQESSATSIFHSLQISADRKFRDGLAFRVAYTYSRSIDTASGIGTGADDLPQNSFDTAADRGLSNFDMPHRFVSSFSYELPFGQGQRLGAGWSTLMQAFLGGWQLTGIVTLQSGQPFTLVTGRFDPLTQTSNKRPDLVGDPLQDVPSGFAFNPAAFAVPADGKFGDLGRNTLRGDGFTGVDLSVFKNFAIPQLGESGNLQFRAEFFNLFNNTNFTFPVRNASSPAFGEYVDNATPPRVVQFALKLMF